MEEIVLLFNFKDKAQVEAIKKSLYLVKVLVVIVPKEKYRLPLKDVVENNAAALSSAEAQGQELDGQMMVFAGFLEGKLDKVLSLIWENPDCGRIPYKAVLTRTNQKWDAYTLLKELKKEHDAMYRQKQEMQSQE